MSGASVVPPGRRCAAKPAFIHFSELYWDYSDLAGQLGSSCGSASKMGGDIIIVRTLGSSKKKLTDLPTEIFWGMLIGIINHRLTLSTVPNADPHISDLETPLVPEISTTWIPTSRSSKVKEIDNCTGVCNGVPDRAGSSRVGSEMWFQVAQSRISG